VPEEWDPNAVYNRFFYMTIFSGKVQLGRFRDQAKSRLRVTFSQSINQLLGYAVGTSHTFERDPVAIKFPGDGIPYLEIIDRKGYNPDGSDGLDRSSPPTKKLPGTEWKATFTPNMDAITLQTLWIMCDVVEHTQVSDKIQRPILRALPNNPYNIDHSLHMFALPQFKRILSSNGVDQLHFKIMEDLDGTVVTIYGDVFIRLEVIENATT
jgi:hypothetical protein